MRKIVFALVLPVLGACGVGRPGGGGGFPTDDAGSPDSPDLVSGPSCLNPGPDGCPQDDCPASAKLVYVVDENNQLSSFKPDTLKFTDIGTLNCPAMPLATPFSMAVDRSAVAWVLYSSGEVFKVDTMTAKCTATSFKPKQLGFEVFGMGFVSNAVNSKDETLFIAGGAMSDITTGNSMLGRLDTKALKVAKIASTAGSPELTGTGDANLWGFFPEQAMPRVALIDRSNGKQSMTFPMSALAGTPSAWAFAFWGGDFWIFLQRDTDLSTTVWHLTPKNGKVTAAIKDTGRKIVGAGVSTCAPITIGRLMLPGAAAPAGTRS